MTCIVGIAADGVVVMGGDSAGVDTQSLGLQLRVQPKVFRNGDFLIGYTTSFRMGQLLEHAFTPPVRHVGQDVFAFMVADFVPAVRRCFEAGGWARAENGVNSGGVFLIGYAGRLFQIESDFQVGEALCGFQACGCGEALALGALHATRDGRLSLTERVARALYAAEAFSAGVREPFTVLEMSNRGAA